MLHEPVPKAALVAVLINRKSSTAASQLRDLQDPARALGEQLQIFRASTERDIETVFASLVQLQLGGLVIGADAFFPVGAINSSA